MQAEESFGGQFILSNNQIGIDWAMLYNEQEHNFQGYTSHLIAIRRRLHNAHERYGWRSITILLYRVCFRWPRLRSKLTELKIRGLLSSKIGKFVSFGKDIGVHVPGGRIEIGDHTRFSDRCLLMLSPNPLARLEIGSHCYFAHDVHFYSTLEIKVGDNVRIGEFTSLRDSSHRYEEREKPINQQGDILGRIVIADDVWIGRGCLILGNPDTLMIGRGAVIGANSVVKDSIPEYAVVVGSPAKIVKYRV